MILVIALTLFSVLLFAQIKTYFWLRIIYAFILFKQSLLISIFIISDRYTGDGITEATLFLASRGLEGASKYEVLISTSIFIVVLLVTVMCVLYTFNNVYKRKYNKDYLIASFLLIVFALFLNPATHNLIEIYNQNNIDIDLSSYEEFNEYYDEPSINKVGDSKNLVFIYLEGLERSYFDQDVFPDLLPNLYEIRSESTDFTNVRYGYGDGHTIGGMVSSLCGIPLTTKEYNYGVNNNFLPGATCLGDLLKSVGYHNVYMGGAQLSFTGKGDFFRQHGFDGVYGKEELLKELHRAQYVNGWGLYDDSLLDIAYEKFVNLSEEEDKFSLFMLTLTTHHPKGLMPKSCDGVEYKDGSIKMLNAVACTDFLIGDFVEKIQNSTYRDKTVIVLATDQKAGKSDTTHLLEKTERKALYLVIDPSREPEVVNNAGFLMDIGLSTLPFIGYEGHLGLARDITIINRDQNEINKVSKNIKEWIPAFSLFWGFPKIDEEIILDPKELTISIDNQKYNAPIVVKYDDKYNTTLTYSNPYIKNQKLVDYTISGGDDRYFIVFDLCRSVAAFRDYIDMDNDGMCMVLGYGNEFISGGVVDEKITLSKEQLIKLE